VRRWNGAWLLLLLANGAAGAPPAGPVGKISIVDGDVLRQRPRDVRGYPPRVGTDLFAGDAVETAAEGVVQMLLGEGMLVTLAAGGSFEVAAGPGMGSGGEETPPTAALTLGHGLLRAFVSGSSREQLEIRTGAAPISVRFAAVEGAVEARADGTVRIICLDGAAALRWRVGSAAWRSLPPGREIVLGPAPMEGLPEPRALGEEAEAELLARTRPIPTLRQLRPRARRPEDYGPPPPASP